MDSQMTDVRIPQPKEIFRTPPRKIKFEYAVEMSGLVDAAMLNEMGAKGWEFIQVAGTSAIFKRPCGWVEEN